MKLPNGNSVPVILKGNRIVIESLNAQGIKMFYSNNKYLFKGVLLSEKECLSYGKSMAKYKRYLYPKKNKAYIKREHREGRDTIYFYKDGVEVSVRRYEDGEETLSLKKNNKKWVDGFFKAPIFLLKYWAIQQPFRRIKSMRNRKLKKMDRGLLMKSDFNNGKGYHMYLKMQEQIKIMNQTSVKKMGEIISQKIDNEEKPLLVHNAILYGSLRYVKFLMKSDIEINKKDQYGNTAFHYAASAGYGDIVKLLIKRGAKLDIVNNNGWTPLALSLKFGHINIAKMILESESIIIKDTKFEKASLTLAVQLGYDDIVRLLFKKGAKWNHKDINGDRIFFIAIKKGYVGIAKMLIKNGASINAASIKYEQLLLEAVLDKKFTIVNLLLKNGVRLNRKNEHGETVLHLSVKEGDLTIVKMLVENGMSLNVRNKAGWTPLHIAVSYGYTEIVKLLLKNNADLTVKSSTGDTALDIAKLLNRKIIVELMLKK